MSLSRSARATRALALVVLALGLIVAACTTPADEPAAPAGKTPDAKAATAPASKATAPAKTGGPSGSLVFAHNRLPATPDPHTSLSTVEGFVFLTYADTLMWLDENTELAGSVAESWEQLDPTTWQFTLREGIEFHNGEPLTAEAVKFTLDRLIEADSGLALSVRFGTVESVEVVDDLTVNVITKDVDVLLARRMIELYILPPQYFEEVGLEGYQENPIGSGPFRVTNFATGRVELEANTDHFRGGPGLAELTFVELPEESSRAAALSSGDAQIAYAINPDTAVTLDPDEFEVQADPVSQIRSIFMRSTLGPPLDNRQVRQAVAYAIDKEAIVDVAVAGLSDVSPGQLSSPGVFGYNPDLEAYPFDPEEGRQALIDAGYEDGVTVGFNYRVTFSGDEPTALAVAQMLDEVGITADLEVLETAVFSERFRTGQLAPLISMAIGTTPLLDADVSYQWLRTEAPTKFYSNPEFDQVFAESRTETDVERREELLQEAARIAHEDFAFVALYNAVNPSGVARNVTGFKIELDGRAIMERVRITE